jgi:TP901-1 family phage major tail protein
MATNAKKGNLFILKLGSDAIGTNFTTVAALRSTALNFTKATVDVSNKDGDGWNESLPGGGLKSASISASGIYTNAASQVLMITAYNAATHCSAQIVDESGNVYEGTWNIDSLSFSGEANAEQTFEIAMSNSGEIEFTAGIL